MCPDVTWIHSSYFSFNPKINWTPSHSWPLTVLSPAVDFRCLKTKNSVAQDGLEPGTRVFSEVAAALQVHFNLLDFLELSKETCSDKLPLILLSLTVIKKKKPNSPEVSRKVMKYHTEPLLAA